MRNKYIVITPYFPTSESSRGVFLYDQVKAIMRNSTYDVIVLRPSPFYLKTDDFDYEYEGVKVYYFKTYNLPSAICPHIGKHLSVNSFLKKINQIGLYISDIKIAHAHVTLQGEYANALKKIDPAIKTVLQHHGLDVLSLPNGILGQYEWHRRLVQRFGETVCSKIDWHVGVSAKTLDCLKQYEKVHIKQAYILYNGVDLSKFISRQRTGNSPVFTIGCVANFWELKDQITLIKAVEILVKGGAKDIRTVFIGSGYLLDTCRKYVETHQLSAYIFFEQERKHTELCSFYNTLDLFVLPSYWEAFGCVYLEAYACGVPFIACKDQGISEYIATEERAKWLIDKSDYKELAKLILRYKNLRYPQLLNKEMDINRLIVEYLHCFS